MLTRRWIAAVLAMEVVVGGCSRTNFGAAVADPSPVVSRAQFDQAFPNRLPFYTYDDFVAATNFTTARDAAMFLANVDHETGGLSVIEESPGRRAIYCDGNCPAGRDAYFGRGPIQLSWNYNYKSAGEVLDLDLLHDPGLVARDPVVAWRTAAWFWNARVPHGGDFGGTIRAINGALECNGGNPAQVQSRVSAYLRITGILGVEPGGNLSC